MLLQISFYTHHLTTLLFGVFLSAFFLGVNQDRNPAAVGTCFRTSVSNQHFLDRHSIFR